MIFRILADIVVVIHAAYVLFVVIGFLLILCGILWKWKWIRHFGFRMTHLVMILIVAAEAWGGITCPLTVWERQLRNAGGELANSGTFIGSLVHQFLFIDAPQSFFTVAYTLFGLLVLSTFILAPPTRRISPFPSSPTSLD